MARIAIDDVVEIARRKSVGELTHEQALAELDRLALHGRTDEHLEEDQ
jgi:hypothetical protein